VRTDLVEVFPGAATGTAFVTYFRDGSRKFLFHWDGTAAVMARVPDVSVIGTPRYLHVMGCSLMANEEFRRRVFAAVELFAAAGARVTFDPNIRFELLKGRTMDEIVGPVLRRSSIIFPGEKDLALLGGRESPLDAAKALFERPTLELIVVKKGSRGCTVISRSGRVDVPAFPVREVDPTGAGDCFDAGFICGQLEGRDPGESALMASAAGALAAQAFGPMEGRIDAPTVAAMVRKARTGRRRAVLNHGKN
jgi:sugar/nucleoside kinase (ribokinase family)